VAQAKIQFWEVAGAVRVPGMGCGTVQATRRRADKRMAKI
jgi:hypothetical protein